MTESSIGRGNVSRERTEADHAGVRRRALPFALGALLCGLAGVVLPMRTEISAFHPPNLIAMNLACCAVLMGAGILYYARGTPGTRVAAVMCIAAILLGLAGSLYYTKQAVDNRLAREQREVGSVRQIAEAARAYAAENGGVFPPDLLVLLEQKRVEPLQLQSTYAMPDELWWRFEEAAKEVREKNLPREDWLKTVEAKSDYLYLGADLKAVPAELAKDILVASSLNTVLRTRLAVSFADGSSRYLTVEEVGTVMKTSNDAREKMGLGMLRPPPIIEKAMEEARKAAEKR